MLPLLSSLSQLLLDPYYRTLDGYICLVEKEWLWLGQKFLLERRPATPARSESDLLCPFFILFIDATWQLLQQHPTTFAFNELFLITLLDHVFNSLFGTFI